MKKFKTTQLTISLQNFPPELSGLKILHLGDLHNLSFGEKNAMLAQAVINADPDYLFATGDFLDRHSRSGQPFIDLLETLGGRFPVVSSLGNHELDVKKHRPETFCGFMQKTKELGVCWLDNERLILKHQGRSFAVYGLTLCENQAHGKGTIKRVLGEIDPDVPAVILSHDPRRFPEIASWAKGAKREPLVLSGHVHGGLIRLPVLGGVCAPRMILFPKYDAGEFSAGNARMFVTRGFGDSFLGFRLNNSRELAVITLERQTKTEIAKINRGNAIRSALRLAFALLLAANCSCAIAAAAVGIDYVGTVIITAVSAFLLLWLCFPRLYSRLRNARLAPLCGLIRAGLIAFAVYFAIVSCFMAGAALKTPPPDATVIVLGCQVNGVNVSQMLDSRLLAALRYLEKNPEANCVVSGGQGSGENISEAEAMRRWLIARGINESRIFLEDKSVSTRENIAFSLRVVEENGLNRNICVATNEFHQLRAQMHVKRQGGGECGASSAGTTYWLFELYWVREMPAIAKAVVIPYL
ncbi:MAG: YdcF family protein [Oscillospiraceae bacterium]|nr:YdcF family protein [Oscillospiraceae bacterium]